MDEVIVPVTVVNVIERRTTIRASTAFRAAATRATARRSTSNGQFGATVTDDYRTTHSLDCATVNPG
jgi:hypothetical protein